MQYLPFQKRTGLYIVSRTEEDKLRYVAVDREHADTFAFPSDGGPFKYPHQMVEYEGLGIEYDIRHRIF